MIQNQFIQNTIASFSGLDWIIFSLASNIGLFLISLTFYVLVDVTCSKQKLQVNSYPIKWNDIKLSMLTILINAFVQLIGVYFLKLNWLQISYDSDLLTLVVEVFAIILIMDLVMYFFHYLAHIPFFYKIIHAKHHEHVSTNLLSLFVLHPIEAFGFGMLMLLVFMSYTFSVYAISFYILINLIWGTVGHLNLAFFPKWVNQIYVGTSEFHNQHHVQENKNFGFYTSVWDRVFKTYKG
nr:sterol desaturase family protein [uncultured Flavobacterium sp.]